MKPFYISSSPSGGLSAFVGGVSVAGTVEFIVIILALFGYHVEQSVLIDLATDIAQAAGMAYALFGLLRKGYYKAKHILENLRNP